MCNGISLRKKEKLAHKSNTLINTDNTIIMVQHTMCMHISFSSKTSRENRNEIK